MRPWWMPKPRAPDLGWHAMHAVHTGPYAIHGACARVPRGRVQPSLNGLPAGVRGFTLEAG